MNGAFAEMLAAGLENLAHDLGSEWHVVSGVDDAYGLPAMRFAGLSGGDELVQAWWWEAELRLRARFDDQREYSDEVYLNLPQEVVDAVRALCSGAYEERDGFLEIKLGRRAIKLREWRDG